MNQEEIIQIIKESPHLTYKEVKVHAKEAGISRWALKKAWKELIKRDEKQAVKIIEKNADCTYKEIKNKAHEAEVPLEIFEKMWQKAKQPCWKKTRHLFAIIGLVLAAIPSMCLYLVFAPISLLIVHIIDDFIKEPIALMAIHILLNTIIYSLLGLGLEHSKTKSKIIALLIFFVILNVFAYYLVQLSI